jgi:hypothetical protein
VVRLRNKRTRLAWLGAFAVIAYLAFALTVTKGMSAKEVAYSAGQSILIAAVLLYLFYLLARRASAKPGASYKPSGGT